MQVQLVVGMALSSLSVVALATGLFRAQPATRRLFIILSTLTLLIVPAVCLMFEVSWTIGLHTAAVPATRMLLPDVVWIIPVVSGLVLIVHHVVLVYRQRLAISRLPLISDTSVHQPLAMLKMAVGVRAPVEVKLGWKACSSTIAGRVIVLPPEYHDWTESILKAVLAHELVHISRYDDCWTALLALVGKGFWWLPWLRMLSPLFERAIEESCDDRAAVLNSSEHAYLDGVFRVAISHGQSPFATAALDGGSIVDRFRRFNQYRQREVDSRGLYWSSLFVCVLVIGLWSARFESVDRPEGKDLRVVARVQPDGDSEWISLKLRERPPPPLEVVSGLDPPG